MVTLSDAQNIAEHGKHLAARQYYNYFINLYLWKDEFYEVWYFRDENKIKKVEKLDSDKKLDLYISNMTKLDRTNDER